MSLGEIGKSVVGSLQAQPALLLLVLINVGFLGFLIWFLEGQLHQRDAMAQQLFERCMDVALKGVP